MSSDKQKQFFIEVSHEEALYLYCIVKNHTAWDDSLSFSLQKKIETIIYNSYSIQELETYLDKYTAICKDILTNGKK